MFSIQMCGVCKEKENSCNIVLQLTLENNCLALVQLGGSLLEALLELLSPSVVKSSHYPLNVPHIFGYFCSHSEDFYKVSGIGHLCLVERAL